MKIAINAVSLRKGGAVTVLHKLLSQFVEFGPQHEYHVLANGSLPRILDGHPQVRYHRFNWIDASYARTALWHAVVLSRWCAREHVDVLFSQVCFLPLFGPRHTVLLLQDAKFFYDSDALRQGLNLSERLALWMKKRWCYHAVASASRILVQSDTMARSVAGKVPSARSRIRLIHHGPGLLDGPQRPVYRTRRERQPRDRLCVALPQVQELRGVAAGATHLAERGCFCRVCTSRWISSTSPARGWS